MLSFLLSFSDSFLLATLAWPFAALALTLPILIIQYRKYNKVIFSRGIAVYGFILYVLGLISFTLYPMPDNAVEFCKAYNLTPQLNPLQFMSDIRTDAIRATMQLGMNILFFVPLGVFGRLLFNWRLKTVVAVGLAASLLIETAQLTGGFGAYPCSYRLFDVTDLLLNTLGATGGYLLSLLIPHKKINKLSNASIVHKPGLLRHSVAFVLDMILSIAITIAMLVLLYFTIGHDNIMQIRDYVLPIVVTVLYGLTPLMYKGWTPGSLIVRLNYNDKKRTSANRIIYYLLKAVMALLLLVPPTGNGLLSTIALLFIILVWRKRKILPYQLV